MMASLWRVESRPRGLSSSTRRAVPSWLAESRLRGSSSSKRRATPFWLAKDRLRGSSSSERRAAPFWQVKGHLQRSLSSKYAPQYLSGRLCGLKARKACASKAVMPNSTFGCSFFSLFESQSIDQFRPCSSAKRVAAARDLTPSLL